VFVDKHNFPSLNIHGLIVSKKKPGKHLEIAHKDLRMKKHKLLYPMQEKEEERETLE
jgi:hypothetical protein